jgi:hypothetical protein
MLHPGNRHCLPFKATPELGIVAHLGREQLDRHISIKARVMSPENGRHAPLSQLFFNFILSNISGAGHFYPFITKHNPN